MKVSIYKRSGGKVDIMVEASVGHGKTPVILQDVTRDDLSTRLGPVLEAQKGPRWQGPAPARIQTGQAGTSTP